MSATSTPYGLIPIGDQVGIVRPVRVPNGIASGLASNIFKGTPVFIDVTTGKLKPVAASTDKIFGVFAGVEYTPTGQRPVVSPFWPSGATYAAGVGDMNVYIWPAWVPGMRWQIQADGAVAQTLLGSEFIFSNFTAGSTTTGISGVTAAAAGVVAASQGQVVLTEFYTGVSDAIGDAYTDLIVAIAYPQVGPGFQTSIG